MLTRQRRQEISRQLEGSEPVEWLVVVKRLDHPIAVGRTGMLLIPVEADGVGVAHQIEPPHRHPLGMPGRGEQPLHQPLVAIGRGIGQIFLHLLQRGRQAGEIKRHPAEQCGGIGIGGRLETFPLQSSGHEIVDPGATPLRGSGRRDRFLRRYVGPVLGIGSPGCDPGLEYVALLVGEQMIALRRGHDALGIGGANAGHEFTFLRIPRHDGHSATGQFRRRRRLNIEPEAPLAMVFVGAVAGKAVVRQDGANIAVEIGSRPPARGRSLSPGAHARCRENHCDHDPAQPPPRQPVALGKEPAMPPQGRALSRFSAVANRAKTGHDPLLHESQAQRERSRNRPSGQPPNALSIRNYTTVAGSRAFWGSGRPEPPSQMSR